MADANEDAAAEARRAKYGRMPPLVRTDDMITSQETVSARDPEGGQDTDRDFTIRHAGS
jgi:hypothetical protein